VFQDKTTLQVRRNSAATKHFNTVKTEDQNSGSSYDPNRLTSSNLDPSEKPKIANK